MNNPKINKKILFTNLIELKRTLVDKFLNQEEEPYIEIYSVAHSWVLFERLIYKGVVKSHNQRRYLAACLRVSVKLYELFGEESRQKQKRLDADLVELLGSKGGVDSNESTNKKMLADYERRVMIGLHFEPRVPPMLVWPHIESIQVMCDKTLDEFLGKWAQSISSYIILLKGNERKIFEDERKKRSRH